MLQTVEASDSGHTVLSDWRFIALICSYVYYSVRKKAELYLGNDSSTVSWGNELICLTIK